MPLDLRGGHVKSDEEKTATDNWGPPMTCSHSLQSFEFRVHHVTRGKCAPKVALMVYPAFEDNFVAKLARFPNAPGPME